MRQCVFQRHSEAYTQGGATQAAKSVMFTLWIASNLTLVALLVTKSHDGTMMVIG